MPAIISTTGVANRSEVEEYRNGYIGWVTLLKSYLISFTIVVLVVLFIISICWMVLAVETCQVNRKKKKEAAKRRLQPPLNPPNLQDASDEFHKRRGENMSKDKLQGEQKRGILVRQQERPIEKQQANYGTITI
ncbi:hypothetical protein EAE96_007790 [Botrytis aclada]|nr:hypothetical protein EAE96_007790 [Botrytis aclada]